MKYEATLNDLFKYTTLSYRALQLRLKVIRSHFPDVVRIRLNSKKDDLQEFFLYLCMAWARLTVAPKATSTATWYDKAVARGYSHTEARNIHLTMTTSSPQRIKQAIEVRLAA